MNNKMAINTYLSTIKSKKTKTSRIETIRIDTENILMVARWGMGGFREMDEKGEGIKKYKLVLREWPWECKVHHREQRSQRPYMNDMWTWTTTWVLPEGLGGAGWGRAKKENWDNCKSINNNI